MVIPGCHHGVTMVPPWCYHDSTMVIFTRRRGNGLNLFPYRHLFFSTSSPGLGPQACTRVGGLLDMASEEVGFGRGEGTCMVAPSPRLFNDELKNDECKRNALNW